MSKYTTILDIADGYPGFKSYVTCPVCGEKCYTTDEDEHCPVCRVKFSYVNAFDHWSEEAGSFLLEGEGHDNND